MKNNFLLTGRPGIGKTTLLKRVVEKLGILRPVGFLTQEIRQFGIRKGFELISLDGRKAVLAHTGIKSNYSVGRYRVDIERFEDFLQTIRLLDASAALIVIDEIGKMECLSDYFKNLVLRILDSDKVLLASIALKGGPFIENIKKRKDVSTFELTEINRETLALDIARIIRETLGKEE